MKLEKPLFNYMADNAKWIERSNNAYLNDLPSYEKIKAKLSTLPRARVYVGKPGNWGRQFTVGEVPVYMNLSRDGYPVIGFLPQSWSPNSDPEQFFDENRLEFYDLYKVGFSILPEDVKPPEFAKLIAREGKYYLYEINSAGWFDTGTTSIAVKSKKTDLLNITRLWFGSKFLINKEYPTIDLSKKTPDGKKWYIQMTDLNNFINLNDEKVRNIWQANPFGDDVSISAGSGRRDRILLKNQQVLVNGYKAQVEIREECKNCITVLKQSYHPNWQVKVNGEKVSTFPVFPFYIGIELREKGNYDLKVQYKPSYLKIFLLLTEIIVFAFFIRKKLITKKET